jgi:plastocyanin
MRRLAGVLALASTALVASHTAVARAADTPEVTLTLEKHRFEPEEIRVKAGTPFWLVVTNKDATPEEVEGKELRVEKVVPGGKTVRILVRALKPGTYPFVGEYHESTAKGRIVAE